MPQEKKEHGNHIKINIEILRTDMTDVSIEEILTAFGAAQGEMRTTKRSGGKHSDRKSVAPGVWERDTEWAIAAWAVKKWAEAEGIDPEAIRKYKDNQAEFKSGDRRGEKYWVYVVPKQDMQLLKGKETAEEHTEEDKEVPF